jgi:hypothetical protein
MFIYLDQTPKGTSYGSDLSDAAPKLRPLVEDAEF